MTINGWIQIAIYCAIVVALVKPLGWFMAAVFNGEGTFLSPGCSRSFQADRQARGVGIDRCRQRRCTTTCETERTQIAIRSPGAAAPGHRL